MQCFHRVSTHVEMFSVPFNGLLSQTALTEEEECEGGAVVNRHYCSDYLHMHSSSCSLNDMDSHTVSAVNEQSRPFTLLDMLHVIARSCFLQL